MDIGAVFLILTIALLAGLFVSRPFLAGQSAQPSVKPRNINKEDKLKSRLLAEYESHLIAMRELDFDQVLGKIPEGDYPLQRQELLLSAADLLRRLDSTNQNTAAAQPQPSLAAAEDRIEAAIAARRAATQQQAVVTRAVVASHPHNKTAQPADNLEELIAARRRSRQDKSNGFCPRCGKPVQQSDRFCPKCGKAL